MRDLFSPWLEKYLGHRPGRANYVLSVLSVVFLVLIWFGAGWWGWSNRSGFIDENIGLLDRHRAVLEMQIQGIFKPAEVFLRLADQWLIDHPETDPRTDPEFERLVRGFQKSTNDSALIRLVAADGALHLVPFSAANRPANVADREYFRTAMSGQAGAIHLGLTFKGRVTGRLAIPLVLKLTSTRQGIVLIFAHMDMEPLLKTLSRQLPHPEASAIILRRDGVLLAEMPGESEQRRSLVGESARFLQELGEKNQAGIVMAYDSAGSAHWLSYGASIEFPVITVIAESQNDFLADWHKRMLILAILLIVLTIAVLIIRGRSIVLLNKLIESQTALRRMATTDALTGVSNRHQFMEIGTAEFDRACRYGRPMALLILDIDHFKRVNDTVLQGVAFCCQKLLREQDTLARCGGEEFVVILPETDLAGAVPVAERIREAVEKLSIEVSEAVIRVTVSIGVTELNIEDNRLDQMYGRADATLYRAKEAGRNQVKM
jgi:diguanylate cyclase (GGDEF)-like protein